MTEPLVYIPVELSLAGRTLEFVESLRSGGSSADPTAESQESVMCQGASWTAEKVATLVDRTSYNGVLALLDALAKQPGTWVPKSVVEQEQGIAPVQLRNELGAFSKLVRRMFSSKAWPMEWRKDSGVYSYRMDPQIASWWLAARDGAS